MGLTNESEVKNSGNGWYVVRLLGRYVVPTCVMEVSQVNRRALSYGMWKLERRQTLGRDEGNRDDAARSLDYK